MATHNGSENIVVKVTTDGNLTGYGEGIPRVYVTGERLTNSLSFLQEVLAPAAVGLTFTSSRDLLGTLAELYQKVSARQCPAAFCALEMALLDAAGKTWDLQVADFIGHQKRKRVIYSVVIPLTDKQQMVRFLDLVRRNGMRFLKLKVGGDSDLPILKMARETLGPGVDIRVDANSAWTAGEAIARLREMQPYGISAVEQPVAKDDFQGLKQVRNGVDIPVIADESLCSQEDAARLIALEACQIFNIRLSKCGGLLTATRIQQMAEQAGVICQLGCHVGETSILSAAGRHFALSAPHLEYLEGSFTSFLLQEDLVAQPVTFHHGGVGYELPGPGLGIEVLDEVLTRLAVSHYAATAPGGRV